MAKMTGENGNPVFADLFYAVVIGFALSNITVDKSPVHYVAMGFLFAIVLEDFLNYYRYVRPNMVNPANYSIHALLVEFSILLFWSIAVAQLTAGSEWYLLFSSLFFVVRWYAGSRHFLRRGKFFCKGFLREQLYAGIGLCLLFLFFTSDSGLDYYILAWAIGGWLVLISFWHAPIWPENTDEEL